MERISSRKNQTVIHFRALGSDKAYRREKGLFLCSGEKLLKEALAAGASIDEILWGGEPSFALPEGINQKICPPDLIQYVSPLKNSPGPIFSAAIPLMSRETPLRSAVVLDGVQDPGNVGTVIRTAAAMGVDAVILVGPCADPWGPKTVRSTMGAVFRQRFLEMDITELRTLLNENAMRLYGALLSPEAQDIRDLDLKNTAVAIGSEGSGLSPELISLCDQKLVIPMEPGSESLNAAVAASLVMWEMYKSRGEG